MRGWSPLVRGFTAIKLKDINNVAFSQWSGCYGRTGVSPFPTVFRCALFLTAELRGQCVCVELTIRIDKVPGTKSLVLYLHDIHCHFRVVVTSASYSRGWVQILARRLVILTVVFDGFFQSLQAKPWQYLELGQCSFLLCLIIYYSFINLAIGRWIVWVTVSVVKLITSKFEQLNRPTFLQLDT